MFVGTAAEAAARSRAGGSALWLLCTPLGEQPRGPLYFWAYVYYVSKARPHLPAQPAGARARRARARPPPQPAAQPATPNPPQFYELADTLLRVCKAQPLTFLHVFHHSAVIWMAWLVRTDTEPCPQAGRWPAPAAASGFENPPAAARSGWSTCSRCRSWRC